MEGKKARPSEDGVCVIKRRSKETGKANAGAKGVGVKKTLLCDAGTTGIEQSTCV
jgi:hypothetical protein